MGMLCVDRKPLKTGLFWCEQWFCSSPNPNPNIASRGKKESTSLFTFIISFVMLVEDTLFFQKDLFNITHVVEWDGLQSL